MKYRKPKTPKPEKPIDKCKKLYSASEADMMVQIRYISRTSPIARKCKTCGYWHLSVVNRTGKRCLIDINGIGQYDLT